MTNNFEVLRTRPFTPSDIDRYLEISAEAWLPEQQAPREQIEMRLKTYPEGLLCAEVDGVLQGIATAVRVNYDLSHPIPTWAEATDGGWLAGVYQSNGNAHYGVDLTVSPKAPPEATPFLLDQVKELVRKTGTEFVVLGARIPFYDSYCRKHGEVPVEQYVYGRSSTGRILDPEIAFYLRNGAKIRCILPDHFPDPPSRNYGVLMVWMNDQRV